MKNYMKRRTFTSLLLSSAASLFLNGVAQAQSLSPDNVYINGKIATVDNLFSVKEAIAVTGDRITAVGSSEELLKLAGPDSKIIDLGGKTVIPGMIDTHTHYIRTSVHWYREARLDGAKTRQEALDRLAAKALSLEPNDWVLSIGGWAEGQFMDSTENFKRSELDEVSPNNPLYLQVDYAHGYVNTQALELAGIPLQSTVEVVEGEVVKGHGQLFAGMPVSVERDSKGFATGRIDGIGAIFKFRTVALGEVPLEKATASARLMATSFNSVGVTTVFDQGGGGTIPSSYEPARKLANEGDLTLRVRTGIWLTSTTPDEVTKELEMIKSRTPFKGDDFMREIAIGEVIYRPLVDFPAGGAKTDPEAFDQARRILTTAAENGWPVHIHAHFKDTISGYLDVIESINEEHSIKPLRWQFCHLDFGTKEEFVRIRELGMLASINASSSMTGLVYKDELGEKRQNMPPLHDLIDSGVTWAFGSDSPAVASVNPFATIGWALTGVGPEGAKIFNQTVSREEALVAHTKTAAHLIFEENNLGTIETGKLADFVVLDRDYLTIPTEEIAEIKPTMVVLGGKTVFGGDQ